MSKKSKKINPNSSHLSTPKSISTPPAFPQAVIRDTILGSMSLGIDAAGEHCVKGVDSIVEKCIVGGSYRVASTAVALGKNVFKANGNVQEGIYQTAKSTATGEVINWLPGIAQIEQAHQILIVITPITDRIADGFNQELESRLSQEGQSISTEDPSGAYLDALAEAYGFFAFFGGAKYLIEKGARHTADFSKQIQQEIANAHPERYDQNQALIYFSLGAISSIANHIAGDLSQDKMVDACSVPSVSDVQPCAASHSSADAISTFSEASVIHNSIDSTVAARQPTEASPVLTSDAFGDQLAPPLAPSADIEKPSVKKEASADTEATTKKAWQVQYHAEVAQNIHGNPVIQAGLTGSTVDNQSMVNASVNTSGQEHELTFSGKKATGSEKVSEVSASATVFSKAGVGVGLGVGVAATIGEAAVSASAVTTGSAALSIAVPLTSTGGAIAGGAVAGAALAGWGAWRYSKHVHEKRESHLLPYLDESRANRKIAMTIWNLSSRELRSHEIKDFEKNWCKSVRSATTTDQKMILELAKYIVENRGNSNITTELTHAYQNDKFKSLDDEKFCQLSRHIENESFEFKKPTPSNMSIDTKTADSDQKTEPKLPFSAAIEPGISDKTEGVDLTHSPVEVQSPENPSCRTEEKETPAEALPLENTALPDGQAIVPPKGTEEHGNANKGFSKQDYEGIGNMAKSAEITARYARTLIVPLLPQGEIQSMALMTCKSVEAAGLTVYGGTQLGSALLDLQNGNLCQGAYGVLNGFFQIIMVADDLSEEFFGKSFQLSQNKLLRNSQTLMSTGASVAQGTQDIYQIYKAVSELKEITADAVIDAISENLSVSGGATIVRLTTMGISACLQESDEALLKKEGYLPEDNWISFTALVDGTGKLAGQVQEAVIVNSAVGYGASASSSMVSSMFIPIQGAIGSIAAPVLIGSGAALLVGNTGWEQSDMNMHAILLNAKKSLNAGEHAVWLEKLNKYDARQKERYYKHSADQELRYELDPLRRPKDTSRESLITMVKAIKQHSQENPKIQLAKKDIASYSLLIANQFIQEQTQRHEIKHKKISELPEAIKLIDTKEKKLAAIEQAKQDYTEHLKEMVELAHLSDEYIKLAKEQNRQDVDCTTEPTNVSATDSLIQFLDVLSIEIEIEHASTKTDWAGVKSRAKDIIDSQPVQALKDNLIKKLLICLKRNEINNVTQLEAALKSASTQEEKQTLIETERAAYIHHCQVMDELLKTEQGDQQETSSSEENDPFMQNFEYLLIQTQIDHADKTTSWVDIELSVQKIIKEKPIGELKEHLDRQLLTCYIKLEKYKPASDLAKEIRLIKPNDFFPLYMQGIADLHLGQLNDARDALNKALEQQTNTATIANIHGLLALSYEKELNTFCQSHQKMVSDLNQKKDKIQKAILLLSQPEQALNEGIEECEKWMAAEDNAVKIIQDLEEKRNEHAKQANQTNTNANTNQGDKLTTLSANTLKKVFEKLRDDALPWHHTAYHSQTTQCLLDLVYWLNTYIFKDKLLNVGLTTASRVVQLTLDCAEFQLKTIQREINTLENPTLPNHYSLFASLLDMTQLFTSIAENLLPLCNLKQISNYHINYYIKPSLGLLSSLGMMLLNINEYLKPDKILDLMLHENLLNIPEVQQYLLEPNPHEPGFYLKLLIGKFLENLSRQKMVSPVSLVSDSISKASIIIQKPVNYLNKIKEMLFSWEAWLSKDNTTALEYSSLLLPKILPLSNPLYLSAICFQKTTQIAFALGDTIVNQNQDRLYCERKYQLKLMAATGNIEANYYLGMLYSYEKKPTKAIEHYQKAAERNHHDAQEKLNAIKLSQKQISDTEIYTQQGLDEITLLNSMMVFFAGIGLLGGSTEDVSLKLFLSTRLVSLGRAKYSSLMQSENGAIFQKVDLITLGRTIMYFASMGLFVLSPNAKTKEGVSLFLSATLMHFGCTEFMSAAKAEKSSVFQKTSFFHKEDAFSQLGIPSENAVLLDKK